MNINRIYAAALSKRAAALLTPEAEQAAMQPAPPPAGAPMPGGMMQAAPPQQAGGMPPVQQQQQQPGLPPEALQDPQFAQWLAGYGVQLDPNTGTLYGPDGQPLPPEATVTAYQAYMEETGGLQQQPQQQNAAGSGGGETDEEFLQFLAQAMGIQPDPNTGTFVDQQGNPVPDDQLAEMYEAFNQQRGMLMQGGQPGMPDEQAGMSEQPAQPDATQAAPAGMGPESMEQLQSIIDASIQGYTAQLDKKLETLIDKLDTLKLAIESMRDTDDKRTASDINEARQVREELAAELNPQLGKTASAAKRPEQPRPLNLFDMLKQSR